MKRLILFLVVLALSGCSVSESHDWTECEHETNLENTEPHTKYDLGGPDKDFVLVNLEAGESPESVSKALGFSLRATSVATKWTGFYIAEVPEGAVPQIEAHLSHLDLGVELESVEENQAIYTQGYMTKKPNDPFYVKQWNMDLIGIPNSLNMSTGRGTVVAILDTGVAYEDNKERGQAGVQDLQNKIIVPGYNTVDDIEEVWDGHGHGTHVAGTVAQDTNNKYGVIGVAPNSSIMPIKVLSDSGRGSTASVADGIVWSAKNGAHVINMSLGGGGYSEIAQEAVNTAHEENVTIVAAAGNSGNRKPSYPAAYDHVIAVSSVDMNADPAPYTQYGPFVDLAAPGGDTGQEGGGVTQETVHSSIPNKTMFAEWQGTSMATPHVAGVASLIREWGVTNPDRIEEILKHTADASKMSDDDGNAIHSKQEKYGAGVLDAEEAVRHTIHHQGYWKLILSFLISLFLFYLLRGKQNILTASAKKMAIFVGTSVFVACGLWFLAFFVPTFGSGALAMLVKMSATSLTTWDFLAFGTHTMLFSSALIPAALVFSLHGMNKMRYVAGGVGIGFASSFLYAAFFGAYSILWIPAGFTAIWLLLNAAAILALVYFALR